MYAQRRQGVALGQHGRQLRDPPLQMPDVLRILRGLQRDAQLPEPAPQRLRRDAVLHADLGQCHGFPPIFLAVEPPEIFRKDVPPISRTIIPNTSCEKKRNVARATILFVFYFGDAIVAPSEHKGSGAYDGSQDRRPAPGRGMEPGGAGPAAAGQRQRRGDV